MQLLHALATILAKSKLLVLPVYPAAWPQAKNHPVVQALFRFYRHLTSLHLMQKTAWRYRQTEHAIVKAAAALGRDGLTDWSNASLAVLDRLATGIGRASRAAAMRVVAGLSAVPLIGSVVRRYAARYAAADEQRPELFSEKARRFFARWSIRFSAEYYEARERAAPAVIEPPASERRT
jgi:hypothetical protein